jgi:hypothetical protein
MVTNQIFEIKKIKSINYPRTTPPPPPPLKITFYMGVQNHAGRLLETGGGWFGGFITAGLKNLTDPDSGI